MTQTARTPQDVLRDVFNYYAVEPQGEESALLGNLRGFKDGAIHLQVVGNEATLSVWGVDKSFAQTTRPARVYRAGAIIAGTPRKILHNTIYILENSFNFHDEISRVIAAIDELISIRSADAAYQNPTIWDPSR